MTRRSRIWFVVSALFGAGNLVGAGFALAGGELLHGGVHVALALVGAYFAQRIWTRVAVESPASSGELDDRLSRLEQSLDAVAIEVERVGEGQRFMTSLFAEQGAPLAHEQGAARPIDVRAREAARPDVAG